MMDSSTSRLSLDGNEIPTALDLSLAPSDFDYDASTVFHGATGEFPDDCDFGSLFPDLSFPETANVTSSGLDPGDLSWDPLAAAPQYPAELVLPFEDSRTLNSPALNDTVNSTTQSIDYGVQFDPFAFEDTPAYNTSDFSTSWTAPQPDWANADSEPHLQPHQADVEPEATIEADISVPANASTREQATHALNVLKEFLHTQSAGTNLDPDDQTTIDRLTARLNHPRKRERNPSESSEPAFTAKVGRVNILASSKRILQDQFDVDPYPTKDVVKWLGKQTRLPLKTIRTWFANTRSRKDARLGEWCLSWLVPSLYLFNVREVRSADGGLNSIE